MYIIRETYRERDRGCEREGEREKWRINEVILVEWRIGFKVREQDRRISSSKIRKRQYILYEVEREECYISYDT